MFQVTKDTIIFEIMQNAPQTAPIFQELGMHCLGCAYATGESIEQACQAHGVDSDVILKKVNDCIAGNA